MRTVKTYLVRKPSDLDEVIDMTAAHPNRAEVVKITETIKLTPEQYFKVAENPLCDFDFLKGKGGYGNGWHFVVELTCEGKQTLYADPSGSSYCRYLGIKVGD